MYVGLKIDELKKLSETHTAKDIMICRRDMVDEGIVPENAAVNPPDIQLLVMEPYSGCPSLLWWRALELPLK